MYHDFQELSHTADLAIRVYGTSFEQLLSHAIVGMFQALKPKIVGAKVVDGRIVADQLPIKREITVTGIDYESVIVDLLSELITLSDVYNEAYLAATVAKKGEYTYTTYVQGAPIEGFASSEIKAVTYHGLVVVNTDHGWQADIVFDI